METTLQSLRVIPLHRLGGAAFILGNVLFLINKLNEMSRLFLNRWMPDVISGQNPGLIFVGQAALIIGYLSFLQLYTPRLEKSGRIALRLLCSGGIILAVGHVSFMTALAVYLPDSLVVFLESTFLLVLLGMLLLIPGLIWFGILNLRRPVMAGWRWLPLATGLMGFTGFFLFSGAEITATFLFFRTLFALGLVGLGLAVWLGNPDRHAQAHLPPALH